jgi:hypothetical protein
MGKLGSRVESRDAGRQQIDQWARSALIRRMADGQDSTNRGPTSEPMLYQIRQRRFLWCEPLSAAVGKMPRGKRRLVKRTYTARFLLECEANTFGFNAAYICGVRGPSAPHWGAARRARVPRRCHRQGSQPAGALKHAGHQKSLNPSLSTLMGVRVYAICLNVRHRRLDRLKLQRRLARRGQLHIDGG